MNTLYFLVQTTMTFAIPLILVAIGAMYCERSGVINIALEGIMIVGAFCSVLFIKYTEGSMNAQLLLLIAVLIAAVSGMAYSLLLAYASINLKSDQVIGGTALNLLAPSLVIFIARMIAGIQQVEFKTSFKIAEVPILSKIPLIGPMFFKNCYITTFIGFALLVVGWFVLYKTKFGLRLRSCGEHPQAADSVGINVYGIRYAGVMISGALGGIGGLVFVITTSVNFNATVSGYGFLALAVLIFGQWKPWRIAAAALFFGLLKTVSAVYSGIPFLAELNINTTVYMVIPYIATLIVLAFSSKNSAAPKAEGVPYDKGAR